MNLIDKILTGGVRRYHVVDSGGDQTVADHSWGVAIILKYLHPGVRADVLMYALLHDSAEKQTGDIPAAAKWAHPDLDKVLDEVERRLEDTLELPTLHQDERQLLKLADMFELVVYCIRRIRSGDMNYEQIYQNGMSWLDGRVHINKRAVELYNELTKWRQSCRK